MSFLKANWEHLILVNYVIEPEILKPFIPAGTELDIWNGKCLLSLVGFMFTNVRLLGMPVPFHTKFEEVNLRFYVKRYEDEAWKRGVVFIKELVPRPALTLVANTVYREHYQTVPMRHKIEVDNQKLCVEYAWESHKKLNKISVSAYNEVSDIEQNSEAEFITEHYFGYTKIDTNRTNEYEVKHPRWQVYEVLDHNVQLDFEHSYGQHFAFLNHVQPDSVLLARGSEISVEHKRRIS